jgi:hypothetical protein
MPMDVLAHTDIENGRGILYGLQNPLDLKSISICLFWLTGDHTITVLPAMRILDNFCVDQNWRCPTKELATGTGNLPVVIMNSRTKPLVLGLFTE